MKVWFDILTPKQLLFFKPFAEYLESQGVECILTSRFYQEVTMLADLHDVNLRCYGKHGKTTETKLKQSLDRMVKLFNYIKSEKPDVAINSCSPDACRIAYGLGIPLFLLNDTPHAEITNRLTMPLAKRVWVPMVFNKRLFTKYGLKEKQIKHYNCIDAHVTAQRKVSGKPPIKEKYVLLRTPETFASYYNNNFDTLSILNAVQKETNLKILVLCRYDEQYNIIKNINDPQIIPTLMKYDGKVLYEGAEFVIGTGGTMSAESALSGVPTIIYDMVIKNYVADYLERHNILLRVNNVEQLKEKIQYIQKQKNAINLRARDVVNQMDMPFEFMYDDIRQVLGFE
jgi:predicted glycosyltransferase